MRCGIPWPGSSRNPPHLPVSTTALVLEAAICLGKEFATARDRRQWQNNSVKRQLQLFLKDGLVERIEGVSATNAELTHWVWKRSGSASVDHLRGQALAAGAAVQQYDDDRE